VCGNNFPVRQIFHYTGNSIQYWSSSIEQVTWSTENYVEVHAVDANVGVILDTEVDVFLDAKAEVARRTEVAFPQLIFPYLRNTANAQDSSDAVYWEKKQLKV